MATFFLVLVIWGVAVDKRAPAGWAGLAIGFVVAADIWVDRAVDRRVDEPGAFLRSAPRPSRSGAVEYDWGEFPIYLIGPIVGGVLAAVVYDFVSDVKKLE